MADINPNVFDAPWAANPAPPPMTPQNYLDMALKQQELQKYSLENAQTLAKQRAFVQSGAAAAGGDQNAIGKLFSAGAAPEAAIASQIPGHLGQGRTINYDLIQKGFAQTQQQAQTITDPEQQQNFINAKIIDLQSHGVINAEQARQAINNMANPAYRHSYITGNLSPSQFFNDTGLSTEAQAKAGLGTEVERSKLRPPVPYTYQGPNGETVTVPYPEARQPSGSPRVSTPGGAGFLPGTNGFTAPPTSIPGVTPPGKSRIGPQSALAPGDLPPVSAPEQYQGLIKQAAEQHNVPPELLTRVLAAESDFSPTIQGPPIAKLGGVRAQGIAQFIPTTAKEQGVDALNPESAIPGAAKYLRQLYEEKGSWHAALQGYLGGNPSNNARYVSKGVPQLALQLDKTGTAGIAPAAPVARNELGAFPTPTSGATETASPAPASQQSLLPTTPGAAAQPQPAATPAATNVSFAGEVPAIVHPSPTYYKSTADSLEGGPQNWVAVGDSLAYGLSKAGLGGSALASKNAKGSLDADAAGGRSPQEVLDAIKAHPERYSGKNVVLSSGVSNGPQEIALVQAQIAALRDAGAANVKVLGVGNKPGTEGGQFFDLGKHNRAIQAAAEQSTPTASQLANAEPSEAAPTPQAIPAAATTETPQATQVAAATPQPIPLAQGQQSQKLILEAGAVPGERPTPPPEKPVTMPGQMDMPYGTNPPGVTPPIPGTAVWQPNPLQAQGFKSEIEKSSERAGKIQDESESSQKALMNVDNFENAMRHWETGKTAELRKNLTDWTTDLGKYLGMDTNSREAQAAHAKLMQTAGSLLGFDLVKALGSREAMQVVNQVMAIKPNLKETPQANKLILDAIRQGLNYSVAKNTYLKDNFQRNGSNFIGLPERFEQFNPIEKFASRVLPYAMPNSAEGLKDQTYYVAPDGKTVGMWDANSKQFVKTDRKFALENK